MSAERGSQRALTWISASDNEERIAAAGLPGIVDAVHADAHGYVPPEGGVDALVSVDAFHYFAQESGALDVLTDPVKKGGTGCGCRAWPTGGRVAGAPRGPLAGELLDIQERRMVGAVVQRRTWASTRQCGDGRLGPQRGLDLVG